MTAGLALLILLAIALGFCVLWLWALVDSLRTPDRRWQEAGQSKLLWVLLIVFLHVVGAVLYLVIARPSLRSRFA